MRRRAGQKTYARSLICVWTASARANASLWVFSEWRSGDRKSTKDGLSGLEKVEWARGYLETRCAGDEPAIFADDKPRLDGDPDRDWVVFGLTGRADSSGDKKRHGWKRLETDSK